MKKLLFVVLIIVGMSSFLYSDDLIQSKPITEEDLKQVKGELEAIKNDIDKIKKKSALFDFTFEGISRVTWGVNIWARGGDETTLPAINPNSPISHGFDFLNTILFKMDLGKDYIAVSKGEKSYNGTEIEVKLKIKSMGATEMMPQGSWYMVDATDDQNNPVKIYLPKHESGKSNVYFGNFQLILDTAKVTNIFDMGIFVNYQDVMEVHQYYGIRNMSQVLKLNHKFFNHGFAKGGVMYYSFDDRYYDPASEESEAVKIWSKEVLFNYNDRIHPVNGLYTQRPHGISFGYDSLNKISDYFRFYIEGGASSKDAFDPKYFSDNSIDYGFFIRSTLLIDDKKVFQFYPKVSLSFAFQSDSVNDVSETQGKCFAAAISLPISYKFNKTDKISAEFNWNLNTHFDRGAVTTMISLFPELVLLNKSLVIEIPLLYSYRNGIDGIVRVGHEDVKWIDQAYDDHMFNLEFVAGFDSQKIFGDYFRYIVKNRLYFTYFRAVDPVYNSGRKIQDAEVYFYEILENEFVFYDLGDSTWSIKEFSFFVNFGLGSTYNARIFSDSSTVDTFERWGQHTALSLETGFKLVLMDKLAFGFTAESPKILVTAANPIRDQQSFGVFKLWSEVKF